MSSNNTPSKISKKIGYKFKDAKLLSLALTHSSYSKQNNERLEFLGDSLVNLIMAEALFEKFPTMKEGDLSRLRAQLVKGQTLAQIALELSLNEEVKLGAGEVKSGGAKRQSILADLLEALIAALYLDSDFQTTKQKVLLWFDEKLKKTTFETKSKDHKTILQEYTQANKISLPLYTLIKTSGQAHNQTFTVECSLENMNKKFVGIAKSKRLAEQLGAQKALEALKALNIL